MLGLLLLLLLLQKTNDGRYDFPPEKRGLRNATVLRDFPPRKIALTLQSPEAVLPPHLYPDSLYGWDYADVITKISRINRFPKKSYPWCSAGGVRAPDLRYDGNFRTTGT